MINWYPFERKIWNSFQWNILAWEHLGMCMDRNTQIWAWNSWRKCYFLNGPLYYQNVLQNDSFMIFNNYTHWDSALWSEKLLISFTKHEISDYMQYYNYVCSYYTLDLESTPYKSQSIYFYLSLFANKLASAFPSI